MTRRLFDSLRHLRPDFCRRLLNRNDRLHDLLRLRDCIEALEQALVGAADYLPAVLDFRLFDRALYVASTGSSAFSSVRT